LCGGCKRKEGEGTSTRLLGKRKKRERGRTGKPAVYGEKKTITSPFPKQKEEGRTGLRYISTGRRKERRRRYRDEEKEGRKTLMLWSTEGDDATYYFRSKREELRTALLYGEEGEKKRSNSPSWGKRKNAS